MTSIKFLLETVILPFFTFSLVYSVTCTVHQPGIPFLLLRSSNNPWVKLRIGWSCNHSLRWYNQEFARLAGDLHSLFHALKHQIDQFKTINNILSCTVDPFTVSMMLKRTILSCLPSFWQLNVQVNLLPNISWCFKFHFSQKLNRQDSYWRKIFVCSHEWVERFVFRVSLRPYVLCHRVVSVCNTLS